MDPVGYKRISKRTGIGVDKDNIVKGVEQENGDYVLLSDDEVREAYPKATQTIEIEAFVEQSDVSFVSLEKPHCLEPVGKGEKVYARLREAMLGAGVIGIARVVMHDKEHLAALIPNGSALMLDTLRWTSEIRPADDLSIPGDTVLIADASRDPGCGRKADISLSRACDHVSRLKASGILRSAILSPPDTAMADRRDAPAV